MRILSVISFFIVSNSLWSFENNFICDVPYTFYPDKEKRYLLEFGERDIETTGPRGDGTFFKYKSKAHVALFHINEKLDFKTFTYNKRQVRLLDSQIIIELGFKSITIDRFTGEMTNVFDKLRRTCESVAKWELDRAIRELKEISEELKQKKYKQEQERLKERKF